MRETECFEFNVNAVVFLDLKKAFDTVDHGILLSKMNFYGIQATVLDWLWSYLSTGTPQCLVNGSLSIICSLKCEVPQCLFIFGRGLYTEGSLSFKIGWAYTWREICISLKIDWASL